MSHPTNDAVIDAIKDKEIIIEISIIDAETNKLLHHSDTYNFEDAIEMLRNPELL